jgi:broad specificity phosphatase PhoE
LLVMPSLVYLVRHGEVENPDRIVYADMPGFFLSERGRAEADAAAAYLGGRGIRRVLASPLDRAQETAEIIGRSLEVAVETVADLTEWLLARRWAGVPWDDLPTVFPGEVEAYLSDPTDLPFSPESAHELGARVAAAIASAAGSGEAVLIVSHQDPLHAGRLTLRREPLIRLLQDRPGHCDVITLEPGDPWTELDHWRPALADYEQAREWPPVEGS